ncbi:LADA_0F12904g1_1 [Lachancea dasiensis]|uniref:Signal recognition particle subunit SRP68 n=1 Tax=Lachancea dasiensis TaxID=1072105 RepID=A0A1G4JN74_9SACH|nr:LADA_0F12904g1_1 [Lachancea dasiensis]
MAGGSKSHYSPLGATYGVRIEQFVETAEDFQKYHGKLNRKLQKLRHHCQLTTKDTKRYSSKERYSKLTHEDYDSKNKLVGTLMLLHAERDLALAETLRLKARQRGHIKKSEGKVVATRLKKACGTCQRLLEVTKNEQDPVTRAEYLIYQKLVTVSYLNFKNSLKSRSAVSVADTVAQELSLVVSALQFLHSTGKLGAEVAESITAQFDYILRQSASREASTSRELRNFVTRNVQENSSEPLISLLLQDGFEMPVIVEDENSSATAAATIHWRRFSAQVNDSKVAEVISEAQNIGTDELSQFSEKMAKWQQALDLQRAVVEQKHNNDHDETTGEDDEILMTYIQYNLHFTTIQRDDILFNRLWTYWAKSSDKSKNLKLTKYKEIERIVHNLTTYLQDVMDLPGVYSDDTLMANLKLATVYYQLHLTAGCLASFYQGEQKHLEALALYIDAQKILSSALEDSSFEEALPGDIINSERLENLQEYLKTAVNSVIFLAEYEKLSSSSKLSAFEPSLLEKLNRRITPQDVVLKNLVPLRPVIRPVGAKPTLFDLAFNYISYDNQPEEHFTINEQDVQSESESMIQDQEQVSKKKGLFGLFGL